MQADIASHAARPDPTPHPATKVTLAFGNDTFPVLVGRLKEDSVEVLQAAVRAALRMLPAPMNTVKAVDAGAIPEFVRLCMHADVAIRRDSSRAVAVAMNNGTAKRAFVEGGLLPAFQRVVEDEDGAVRANAAEALETLAYAAPWPDALQAAGYVPLLVKRAETERIDGVKVGALRALAKVVNAGSPGQREAVADSHATEVCVALLAHFVKEVREEAARVLGLLAFSAEGKVLAVKAGAIPALNKAMAEDSVARVRAEAAGAAMAIAVDNLGKEAFLDAGLEPLVGLLKDADAGARLNSMRAISNAGANPDARQHMVVALDVASALQARIDDPTASAREQEVAKRTLEVVSWVP